LKWSGSAACFQDETTMSHKHTTLTKEEEEKKKDPSQNHLQK